MTRTISASAPDQEINAAVAEFVLKHQVDLKNHSMRLPDENAGGMTFESWLEIPNFATSSDSILPLLEARAMVIEISYCSIGCTWSVNIVGHKTTWRHTGESNEPLARVACMALLASHGFTVTA